MSNKAIFFDRDGIVNYRKVNDYIKKVEEFKFIPAFFETLKITKQNGYLALLVTNQQGIDKGLYTAIDLAIIHNHMQQELLRLTGYKFDDIAFCPSLHEVNDFRRKPNPGMILEFIEKYNLEPNQCWMIGDSESDILAAENAEIKSILIRESFSKCNPTLRFDSLEQLNRVFSQIIRSV